MAPHATLNLRQQLARQLVESGDLQSEAWRRAVERVPREIFVPHYFDWSDGAAHYELINGEDAEQRDRWLAAVYDPFESLVTDFERHTGYPTSSSTMPAIVVAMLEVLEPQPGHRVLEIGTGSGYSTALLSERLGSESVTSIEVDPRLAADARERLSSLGYHPAVLAGDGIAGYASNAPYDRVVSTCTVRSVPSAWVEQSRPGGRILATLPDTPVLLTVQGDGSASGRLTRYAYGFMNARGHSPAHLRREDERRMVAQEGDTRPARVDPRTVLGGEAIPWFWHACKLLVIPYCSTFTVDESRMGIVAVDDLSWVVIDHSGTGTITQGGPRRVWDECEELYEQLESLGRPERTRFGLTVAPDGAQHVWLDSPSSEHRWSLR